MSSQTLLCRGLIATNFASRGVLGQVVFGIGQKKLLKSIIHWVNDHYRVSATPDIYGMSENGFKSVLEQSVVRAKIRDTLMKESNIKAAAADPGPLDSEKKWKKWEEKFTNYLRCLIGTFGVPLSYVIRDNKSPKDPTIRKVLGLRLDST